MSRRLELLVAFLIVIVLSMFVGYVISQEGWLDQSEPVAEISIEQGLAYLREMKDSHEITKRWILEGKTLPDEIAKIGDLAFQEKYIKRYEQLIDLLERLK